MSLCDKCVCAPVCANRDFADPEIMQHCAFSVLLHDEKYGDTQLDLCRIDDDNGLGRLT